MQFAKRLREGVRNGDITCSVRIWQRVRVKVGNSYSLPPGHIVVDSVMEIVFSVESGYATPDLIRFAPAAEQQIR